MNDTKPYEIRFFVAFPSFLPLPFNTLKPVRLPNTAKPNIITIFDGANYYYCIIINLYSQ